MACLSYPDQEESEKDRGNAKYSTYRRWPLQENHGRLAARVCPKADDVLKRYTKRLVANLEAPRDHSDVMAKGEAFINNLVAR